MNAETTPVELKAFPPALAERLRPGLDTYDYRFCSPTDWEAVRLFLNAHWSESHPYVTQPDFTRWQQYDASAGRYNVAAAFRREDGAVHGVQAFIPVSQFDPSIPVTDVWPGLWCVHPDAAPGLGSEVTRFLVRETRARSVGSLGLSRNTQTILPRMGYTMGAMDRHAMLNPDLREFRLIDPADAAPRNRAPGDEPKGELRELGPDDIDPFMKGRIDPRTAVPMKTAVYVRNRFALHPYYRYRMFAATGPGGANGLIVTRTAEADGARAVRVVDFLGNETVWAGLRDALIGLMREESAEFIDILSRGIDTGLLVRAGLFSHRAADPLILPHYFEPLERRNKDLAFGFVAPAGPVYRMFKADSDQDRPNLFTPAAGSP